MMLKPDSAHTSHWRIGEVVFGIPFLVSLALHVIWPFSFTPGILRQALLPVGGILSIVGLGFLLRERLFSGDRILLVHDLRMQNHQVKKTAHLRALRSWESLFTKSAGAGCEAD